MRAPWAAATPTRSLDRTTRRTRRSRRPPRNSWDTESCVARAYSHVALARRAAARSLRAPASRTSSLLRRETMTAVLRTAFPTAGGSFGGRVAPRAEWRMPLVEIARRAISWERRPQRHSQPPPVGPRSGPLRVRDLRCGSRSGARGPGERSSPHPGEPIAGAPSGRRQPSEATATEICSKHAKTHRRDPPAGLGRSPLGRRRGIGRRPALGPAGALAGGGTAPDAHGDLHDPRRSAREAGECGVFYFGKGRGGSVEENLDRWVKQFESATPPQRSEKTVHGVKVHRIDVSGTYMTPGAR